MSNETNTAELEATDKPVEKSELDILKAQADRMGITYSANISLTTLKGKIQKKLSDADDAQAEEEATSAQASVLEDQYDNATQLVRVIVTCLDSIKASNMDTDVFTVSNRLVGTISRTIPFGREWHVERILLNSLRERKYQQFTSKKNERGILVTTARLVPAYNIVELPPLTQEELDALALTQARTGSLSEED